MFKKRNMIYAEVGNYLQHKTDKIIALSVCGVEEDYEELPLNNPLDINIRGSLIFFQNNKLAFAPKDLTKDEIKKSIIKSRYSVDDQMALILNKEESKEDELAFERMQKWREFAAEIARIVTMKKE